MLDRRDVSLGFRPAADGVVLVDRACGTCATCVAGARLWCPSPVDAGVDLSPSISPEAAEVLAAALTAAAALIEAPTTSTVVVVGEESGPLAQLVAALRPGNVLVGPDPFDLRLKARLAELEPTGRAAVIVAGRDARAAVKAVRRGGHVCVGDAGARMPSVTELVQREVQIVGPRDVSGVIRRIGDTAWGAAIRAAA